MSDITLSKAVRSNLLSLQNTATLMGKTQERLATGLKVNSALDNPTNFFTASALNSRASDLGLLLDSVSNATQTLAAADKGISAITKLVESAQATARQALQSAATIAETDTTVTAQASVTGDDVAATHGGGSLTINGITVTVAADATATAIAAQFTGHADYGDANFTIAANGDALEISGANDANIVISGAGAANAGLTAGTTTPTTEETVTQVANPKRAEFVEQFNDLLVQIDDLAKDSGFNGVNLLALDELSVLFNEDGSSKLDISGVDFSSTGLGLAEIAADAFDTNDSINGVLDDLKAAIDSLRTQASRFGSNLSVVETRENFTKEMINVLQTGAANLTLADTNEEAANLLALQTRQQLSTTALSMASQADQNVLRLF